jgi:ribosomal protein S18 acetylase RimI-like enzyme
MEIRRAILEDAMAIATVHVRSWKAAYPGLIPQRYLDSLHPEDRVEGWQQVLSNSDWPREGVLLLVDTSGESNTQSSRDARTSPDAGPSPGKGATAAAETIMGFSHICPTRDEDLDPTSTGEITSIYLAPEAWGAGNGVMLIQASISEMVTAGFEEASLWALNTNVRARRFYETGGWVADGVTKVHDWGSFTCIDVRYMLDLRDLHAPQ